MVLSKLNKNISYTELKGVNKNDLKMEVNLYQLEIIGIDVIVAVGNSVNTFEDENVTYFPLYLVKSNNKIMQIGVYEIHSTDLSHFLDDEGSLDLEKMDDPLIYKFVTKSMLLEKRMVPEKEKEDVDSESDEEESEEEETKESDDDVLTTKEEHVVKIPENRRDVFVLTKNATVQPLLSEETTKDAESLRDKFNATVKSGKGENWVQNYMQNKNYYLVDNEGGGDCLFATIRDAFSSIVQQTSVAKIRKKLANEITEEVFLNYREQFNMYKTAIEKDTTEVKRLQNEYITLQKRFVDVLDRNEKKLISEQAKKIKAEHDKITEERKITLNILDEFKFMKNVDTLEKFKTKIKSCDFWADTWAISTLERILNIKFIILSSDNYNNGDVKNVIQCGQLNDSVLENKGIFKPEFYIIVDHTGNHYKVISYKKKMIFNFKEIPYDIKKYHVKNYKNVNIYIRKIMILI
jgi:hypothetical protein